MVRILLVEDDETIVRTLKDFLQTEGFIVESTDGQKKAFPGAPRHCLMCH